MKTLRGIVLLAIVGVLLLTNNLSAENRKAKSTLIHLKELMTLSVFKDCGIDKLSDAELTKLDNWLQNYTMRVMNVSDKTTSSYTPDVIESQIEGEFSGWEGETIFKLTNGQIWQQSSYAYTYHYAYRPKVLIYKTGGGYKMKVEDVDNTIYVKRLK